MWISSVLLHSVNSFLVIVIQCYLWTAGLSLLTIALASMGCRSVSTTSKYHYYLKFALAFLAIWGSGLVLWPIYLLRPNNGLNFRYTNWFYKITTVQLDISTEFRNIHLVQKDQAAVICINHQSALDAILLLMFAPHAGRISPIAKKELLYLVPLGFCCWLAGIKLIDRSSPEAAYKTLSRCVEEMKRDNIKLIIFPEGTRGHGKGTSGLLPFKRGAFKTAIMGQVPIIPLVVSPYYFIDHGKREFYKGHVILKALEPIPTKGMTDDDHEGLMMKTKGVMLREYEKLAAEVEGFK